jgi:hypothetical protein
MNKLAGDEIRKREALKAAMDNELFKEALFDVKRKLADEAMRSNDRDTREKLYFEAQLLNRLEATLTEYCTELLFLEQKKKEEAA